MAVHKYTYMHTACKHFRRQTIKKAVEFTGFSFFFFFIKSNSIELFSFFICHGRLFHSLSLDGCCFTVLAHHFIPLFLVEEYKNVNSTNIKRMRKNVTISKTKTDQQRK